MIGNAIIMGLIWSAVWILYVFIILKRYPWEMLHDYPRDVQEAATIPEPSEIQKKRAKLFGAFAGLVIFGLLLLSGLLYFRHEPTTFLNVLLYVGIVAMAWNVVDLLIMDWLINCLITPQWIIIPGTEGCKGYKDYFFHFKGFLIGCVYTAIMALLFAGIDYVVLRFLIWK
ncbi:MAG: hypothetical protein IJ874_03075 [Ruminococcus sp.]|nr:hypothetical protein [Ruminococcus sp.]